MEGEMCRADNGYPSINHTVNNILKACASMVPDEGIRFQGKKFTQNV